MARRLGSGELLGQLLLSWLACLHGAAPVIRGCRGVKISIPKRMMNNCKELREDFTRLPIRLGPFVREGIRGIDLACTRIPPVEGLKVLLGELNWGLARKAQRPAAFTERSSSALADPRSVIRQSFDSSKTLLCTRVLSLASVSDIDVKLDLLELAPTALLWGTSTLVTDSSPQGDQSSTSGTSSAQLQFPQPYPTLQNTVKTTALMVVFCTSL